MLPITLQTNKRQYLAYNAWRKKYFLANSPKDGNIILHLLPWFLSVNHPLVPGYIQDMEQAFHVYNIEGNNDILRQESQFKIKFNIKDDRLSVRYPSRGDRIEGIYTIGSVGTISQTSQSDCDIWICIERSLYSEQAVAYLNSKINLIKGWLDEQIKMPVYFFLTDAEDVRNCRFGNIDFESSGSAQRNVLKEEFYRTSILIAGKVPFWWVCYDPTTPVDYAEAFRENLMSDIGELDLIDLGDLQAVDQSEFYGAALWQLNKSLTHPLKSIIKMLLLKMFLEA
ncbi:MAG: class I adenylate cyclase, partial [Smithellaceae bacterium]